MHLERAPRLCPAWTGYGRSSDTQGLHCWQPGSGWCSSLCRLTKHTAGPAANWLAMGAQYAAVGLGCHPLGWGSHPSVSSSQVAATQRQGWALCLMLCGRIQLRKLVGGLRLLCGRTARTALPCARQSCGAG